MGTRVPDLNSTARARLVGAVAEHAAARPGATAVWDSSGNLRYDDLVNCAGALASSLSACGVGQGSTVVLHLPHGGTSVVGILGVLMVGGRYVVLDPRAPVDWRRDILLALERPVLVTDPALDDHWCAGVAVSAIVLLNRDDHASGASVVESDPAPRHTRWSVGEDEAYVLFTSGSRGTPKGVRQSVSAVLAMAQNQVSALGLEAGDRVSLLTSFGYDMAGVDLWSALLAGATLVCVDLAECGVAATVAELAATRVSVVHAAATVWRILLEEIERSATPLDGVRLVLIGGEPAHDEDVNRSRALLGEHLAVAHGYGASEVSFVSLTVLRPGDEPGPGQLSTGRPLPGLTVRRQEGPREHPRGAGAFVVSGPLVALGYLHGPDPAFTQTPDGTRCFHTGDVGEVLPDGSLLITGRADRQVTVLGHRIEPEELEAVLGAVDGVRDCAVVPVGSPMGTRLVAYCTPGPGGRSPGVDLQDRLREAAARRFPPAVRPVASFVREALPLTVSGKIDRLSLERAAADDLAERNRAGAAHPVSETTAQVLTVFADVLGQAPEDLPTDATFFELGGHSVQLAPLRDQLRRTCPGAKGITVPTILTHPTPRSLGAFLEHSAEWQGAPPGVAVRHAAAAAAAAAAARRARRVRKHRG